jgi:putative copper resistance protein D
MAEFVDVLLRALDLAAQSLVLGGIAFVVIVLRRDGRDAAGPAPGVGRALRLVAYGAVVVVIAQTLGLIVRLQTLADGRGWPLLAFFETTYFWASALHVLAGLSLIVVILALGPRAPGWPAWGALLALGVALAGSSAWMSHAAGRLEPRAVLLVLDGAHQVAAGVWLGGLVHLMVAVSRSRARAWQRAELQRFSTMAVGSVATLIVAGAALSIVYVDSVGALVGTAYGLMISTKVALLAGLLVLGATNFRSIRRLPDGPAVPGDRLRAFVEVEVGLGAIALLVAASLTSLPPAIDVVSDRVPAVEVAKIFTPAWPRLTSPAIGELPIDDPLAPRTAEDRAWSEYNHHVAGLFVLAMGCLALVQYTPRGRWARHWPLLFLGLAGFLLLRTDPSVWPLGPVGFWASLAQPQVVQHRFFVLLVIGFGLFEWMVRTDRLRAPRHTLAFPLLCAVGGGLLIAHGHAMLDVKGEFLAEVTHAPLGLLAIVIGVSRWLEVRLAPAGGGLSGWLSSVGFVLVGELLLFYRES